MGRLYNHICDNKAHYILMAIVAIVALVMNHFTTLKGDDYVYALQPGDIQHRCETFADYLRTAPTFYANTNGRLADATERLFASLLGKPIFNVINALMLLMFIEGVYTLAVGRNRDCLTTSLLLVAIGVIFPYPGETLMWMAGSCNYLWSNVLTISLLCLLKYSARYGSSWWSHLVIAAFAFVAGAFNESTSMSCLLGLSVFFVFNRRLFTPIRRTALIAYLMGVCVTLLSPALWVRLDGGGSVNVSLPLVQMMTRRILMLCYMSLRFVTPLIVWVLMARAWRSDRRWRAITSNPGYCLFLGSVMVALALGLIIERPYTFMVSVCMTLCLQAFYPWLVHRLTRNARLVATAVCLMLCAVGGGKVIADIVAYHEYDCNVVSQMRYAPRQCIIQAVHASVSSRWIVPDVYDNDAYKCAYRTFYSYYFNKDNVQFLSPELYRRYTAGQLLHGAVVAPFVSSDTTIATTLLALPGQNYALMPLADGFAPGNGRGKVFRVDIEQYWGKEATQRRYLLGSLLDHVPIRPYWLMADGRPYEVIAGALDDKVMSVEMKFYRDGGWRCVTFTRQTPD